MLSECIYGRTWHAAREIALGPELAATALARRPYDLRHAALSLWLNATGAPAEVAARAGNSVHVLHDVYAHCIDGREDLISQQIEDALDPDSSTPHVSQCVTASGYTHRRHRAKPCPLYVRERSRAVPRVAHALRPRGAAPSLKTPPSMTVYAAQTASESAVRDNWDGRSGPRMAHRTQPTVCVTAPFARKSR